MNDSCRICCQVKEPDLACGPVTEPARASAADRARVRRRAASRPPRGLSARCCEGHGSTPLARIAC
eukprot:6212589-Pleurochrysis_carterae.AAC.2